MEMSHLLVKATFEPLYHVVLDSLYFLVFQNYLRVVEVWLDPEHKEYYYTREPTIRGYPPGNITAQLDFKKKNKCRSFKWFLNNVATEVTEKFPFPPPNHVWGEVSTMVYCV